MLDWRLRYPGNFVGCALIFGIRCKVLDNAGREETTHAMHWLAIAEIEPRQNLTIVRKLQL